MGGTTLALSRWAVGRFEGPLRVKSAVFSARSSLPVFPDKQTLEASVGMSQRCQGTKSLRDNPLRRAA
jgi:hypothetical protein